MGLLAAIAACGASTSGSHPPVTPHSRGPISDAQAQRLLNACKAEELITTHNAGVQLVLTDGNWALWRIPDDISQVQADYYRRCKRALDVAIE